MKGFTQFNGNESDNIKDNGKDAPFREAGRCVSAYHGHT